MPAVETRYHLLMDGQEWNTCWQFATEQEAMDFLDMYYDASPAETFTFNIVPVTHALRPEV